jgi:2-amino-4-hydroxy-6-hydroxymethyldihydropteridine diphosphokinase
MDAIPRRDGRVARDDKSEPNQGLIGTKVSVSDGLGIQLRCLMMIDIVYLSLGSNLGQRQKQLRAAIERLGTLGRVVSISSFYETQPVEVTDQPWFLNCAVALETNRSPQELLAEILAIERDMGRERTRKKGPRKIDIDILLFGDQIIQSPQLSIPHPAMHRRRFALEPLAEIAAEVRHPLLKKTVKELLAELRDSQVVCRFEPGSAGPREE